MAEEVKSNFKYIIRVANVDLPGEKIIKFALTKIKGVGMNFADALCAAAGIDKFKPAGNLSEEQIAKLNKIVLNPFDSGIPTWMFNHQRELESGENRHLLAGTLGFTQDNDIKRLKKIKAYRGIRHQKGLPVRGQRTKSNFRKSKGRVIGVKKKALAQAKKSEKK